MDIVYILLACCVAGVLLYTKLGGGGGGASRAVEAALERDIQLMEMRLANLT